MRLKRQSLGRTPLFQGGFSLIEGIVGMGIMGLTLVSLFVGVNNIVSVVKYGQQEAKASEIITETLDSVRLYSWNQITNAGFLPSAFEVSSDTSSGENVWNYSPNTDTNYLYERINIVNGAPTTETTYSDATGGTAESGGSGSADTVYAGSITVGDGPVAEGYGSSIKQVTVVVKWEGRGAVHQTQGSMFITQYGVQGHIVN